MPNERGQYGNHHPSRYTAAVGQDRSQKSHASPIGTILLVGMGVAAVAVAAWRSKEPAWLAKYPKVHRTRAEQKAEDARIAALRKEWRKQGWRPGEPVPEVRKQWIEKGWRPGEPPPV